MLVLTRKLQEKIQIGADITITVLRVKGNQVRVGIEAPKNVRVVRAELPRHDAESMSFQVEAVQDADDESTVDVEGIVGESAGVELVAAAAAEVVGEPASEAPAPKLPSVGRRYIIRQQPGKFGRPQVTAVAAP